MSKFSYSPIGHEQMAILIALAARPLTRAEVPYEILADSVGAILLSKSSYYRYIKVLEESKYIQFQESYSLTDKGWKTLHQELARIEQQRRILKHRLHI